LRQEVVARLSLGGGLELGTGTGPYGACRSTQCCLAVRSR